MSFSTPFFKEFIPFLVAQQPYRVTVPEDSVIVGNDVVIKCNIPSFVADFVSVTAWVTSEGTQLKSGYVNGKRGSLRKKQ